MRRPSRFFFPALLAAALAAGCGHIDLSAPSDPHRVLLGTIELNPEMVLPDDAVIFVRVVDSVPQTQWSTQQAASVPTTLKRPLLPPDAPPEVLGEKSFPKPGSSPIPFRVEYTADDEQLRQGLNIEARVSIGGNVRFLNSNHYSIGINDYKDPRTIRVDLTR